MAESALRAIAPRNMQQERMDARRARIGMEPYVRQAQTKTAGQAMADMLGGLAVPTGFIPGIGDATGLAADAAMYANYPEERTLGNAAWTLAGLLPLVPGAAAVRAGKQAAEGALDMSQAARMQRADEMGLDPSFTLYHGTGDDIQEFDLNIAKDMEGRKRGLGLGSGKIYLHGDPQSASMFAMNASRRGLGQNPNVMQLISTGNYIDENDYKKIFMENSGGVEITSGNLNMRERDALIKKTDKQVIEKGFDGIAQKYKDSSGNVVGFGQVAIFDPANIRSINADFDPAKRNSPKLMAGVAGAAITGSALRTLVPQEENPPR